MKKIFAALAVISTLALTACGGSGNDEKVIEGAVANNNVQSTTEKSEASEESKEAAVKGYAFVYGDTAIEVDANMQPVLDAIGEPLSYFEAASCAFEGLDKIYTYAGVVINTYPQGDKDFVSSIILQDDSVSTAEGVCIGGTKQDMLNAYGDGYTEENGMLVYAKDGMKLCFIVKDDEITSIQYFSTVLDE